MGVTWRIELLGGLRALSEDREITRFRTQKTGLLLAYLACSLTRSQPRELLLDLFWPDQEEEHARHSLSMALTSLRRLFEPAGVPARSMIVADRSAVGLNAGAVSTDVGELEAALRVARQAPAGPGREQHLTRAIEIYRGPLLPGYYEEWVLSEQRRLAELYWEAVGELTALLEAGGAPERALPYARRAVEIDPVREEAHLNLMRLHAAAGQPAAAIRQYRDLEQVLERELGVAPSAPARRLVREIAGPAERVPDPTPAPPPSEAPCPQGAQVPRPTGTVTFLLVGAAVLTGKERVAASAAPPRYELEPGAIIRHSIELSIASFSRACDALACAVRIQGAKALGAGSGPGAPCRIALHTGDLDPEAAGEEGPVLERAMRLLRAAHAGQILCSEETALLARRLGRKDSPGCPKLVDLGMYWLQDAETPERLYQAEYEGMPGYPGPQPNAEPIHGGNLPPPLTRFFGRDEELGRLIELVLLSSAGHQGSNGGNGSAGAGGRLITLRGVGGTGKTRLALEAASRLAEVFHGAVWFVSLADIADPRLIYHRILDAVRISRSPGEPPLHQLAATLSRRPALLILDNLEHLLPDASLAVRKLLVHIPTLTCLATSRQSLNLAGEQVFPLAPLPTPEEVNWETGELGNWEARGTASPGAFRDPAVSQFPGSPIPQFPNSPISSPERLLQYESARLFVDRALAVRPDFRLTDANAAVVAELCRRLEGIPLAIELAAAQARLLTPGQMLAQLGRRIDLLATRNHDVPERHQTLYATIDWSYRLLPPELQRFFALLSAFRGGWTPEAAEFLWNAQGPTPNADVHPLEALGQLEEASLIYAEELPSGMRFRMLEAWRAYAHDQLDPEALRALSRSHAAYYLSLAEEAERAQRGPEQGRWLAALAAEQDNLRAALQWSLENDPETALRLGTALLGFWEIRCHMGEGRMWLGEALKAAPADALARARALFALSVLAHAQDDRDGALAALEESAALLEHHENGSVLACALAFLGYVRSEEENGYAAGRAMAERAVAIFRELDDRPGIAYSLSTLGRMAGEHGEASAARPLLQESLAVCRDLGDRRGIALALRRLSTLAGAQGDWEEARRLCEEAAAMFREIDDRLGLAYALYALGSLAADRDASAARALLDESLTIISQTGNARMTAELLDLLELVAGRSGDAEAARAYRRESERLLLVQGLRRAA